MTWASLVNLGKGAWASQTYAPLPGCSSTRNSLRQFDERQRGNGRKPTFVRDAHRLIRAQTGSPRLRNIPALTCKKAGTTALTRRPLQQAMSRCSVPKTDFASCSVGSWSGLLHNHFVNHAVWLAHMIPVNFQLSKFRVYMSSFRVSDRGSAQIGITYFISKDLGFYTSVGASPPTENYARTLGANNSNKDLRAINICNI